MTACSFCKRDLEGEDKSGLDFQGRIYCRRLDCPGTTGMRRFLLQRTEDVTGLSGTGIVAVGVEFKNGMCALTWQSQFRTVTVHESIRSVNEVHGHEGRTKVVWIDDIDGAHPW